MLSHRRNTRYPHARRDSSCENDPRVRNLKLTPAGSHDFFSNFGKVDSGPGLKGDAEVRRDSSGLRVAVGGTAPALVRQIPQARDVLTFRMPGNGVKGPRERIRAAVVHMVRKTVECRGWA